MNSMFQGATSFDKDIRTWVTKGGILSSGVTFVDMFNNATAMTVIFGTSGTNPDPFYGNTPQVQFFNSPRLDFTFVIPSTETGDEDFRIPLTGSYSGTGTATFSVLTPASAVPTVTSITSNNPETTYKNTTGSDATVVISIAVTGSHYFTALGSINQWKGKEFLTEVSTTNTSNWGLGTNGGNPALTSLSYGFYQASTLTTVPTQIPSTVTDLSYTFRSALLFNQNINSWTTTNVTDMTGLFMTALDFNQPLNTWNVSSVTSLRFMFRDARSFDQSIDAWDVLSVVNISQMFKSSSGSHV